MERERQATQKEGKTHNLTERQLEILELLALGLTYEEISKRLYLSQQTIKNHFSALDGIFDRLGLKGKRRNSTAALAMAIMTGVIEVPDHPPDYSGDIENQDEF